MSQEEKANRIVGRLCRGGWEAYIAGGAARDILNGEVPSDYDVVTNATYDEILSLFRDRKTKVVGAGFRVCLVEGIEVATYRRGVGLGSPDPAASIQEDLARRDLTINAMAFCPYNGNIVDEHGGLKDLKNRIIRFTEDPEKRILEDPCRIIRACRFMAKLEGRFDPETGKALQHFGYLVREQVAPERIRLEIIKALQYARPSIFFNALHEIDVLKYVSPGFESCYGHPHGKYHAETVDEHIKMVGDHISPRNPLLRLAGYWHDHGKPAAAVCRNNNVSFPGHSALGADMAGEELARLKFSQKEVKYIQALTLHHMRSIHPGDKPRAVRRTLKKLKDDQVFWKDWLRLKIADTKGNLKKSNLSAGEIKGIVFMIREELRRETAFSIKDLAINGTDVIRILNIGPGPRIGEILNKLLEKVLDDPDLNTRERLIQLVDRGLDR